MKFQKILAGLVLAFLLTGNRAVAKDIQMIFWYPGEAGTTEMARPTLDLFFDYINAIIVPDKITGQYFNTTKDGLSFIKGKSPTLGIISFATFSEHVGKLGKVSVLLKTLPLPAGKTSEEYVIVGKGPRPANWNTALFSKQPLTLDFVKKYILPTSDSPQIVTVPAILPLLRDLSTGAKSGGAILKPTEYFAFKNLDQPWTKELALWQTSPAVPTAPVVLFGDGSALTEKIKKIMVDMSADPEGIAILNELRLKGFND